MGLKKIVSYLSCDKCGIDFEAVIANDAQHDPGQTIFELVRDAVDFVEVPSASNAREIREAGYHDGEFFCPSCWEPVSERLFIEDIKSGRENLDWMDVEQRAKYERFLPSRALPRP